MAKRRNVPAVPVFASEYNEEARKSAILDPSPLVTQQFCRESSGSHDPLGRAVDLPVQRSSSWASRHGDFEND